jgi:hypothetical protein
MFDPHGDVACRVVKGLSGVRASGPPAPDYDCRVPVYTNVMLVAVRLFPTALPGPEGGESLLLPHDPSPVVDLRVIRRHKTVESIDVELQVREKPFAFTPEDLLDCRQNRRLTIPTANPRDLGARVCPGVGGLRLLRLVLAHRGWIRLLAELAQDAAGQQDVTLARRVLGE